MALSLPGTPTAVWRGRRGAPASVKIFTSFRLDDLRSLGVCLAQGSIVFLDSLSGPPPSLVSVSIMAMDALNTAVDEHSAPPFHLLSALVRFSGLKHQTQPYSCRSYPPTPVTLSPVPSPLYSLLLPPYPLYPSTETPHLIPYSAVHLAGVGDRL
jgi:hypothetical protein